MLLILLKPRALIFRIVGIVNHYTSENWQGESVIQFVTRRLFIVVGYTTRQYIMYYRPSLL